MVMKIKCQQCASNLSFDGSKIPSQGARIKCPKCNAMNFVEKPLPESSAETPISSNNQKEPVLRSSSSAGFEIGGKNEALSQTDEGGFWEQPIEEDFGTSEDLFGSPEDLDSSGARSDLTPTMVFDPTAEAGKKTIKAADDFADSDAPAAAPDKNYPNFDWPDPVEGEELELTNTADDSAFAPGLSATQGQDFLSRSQFRLPVPDSNDETVSVVRRWISLGILVTLLLGGGGYAVYNLEAIVNFAYQNALLDLAEYVGIEVERPKPKVVRIATQVAKTYEHTNLKDETMLVIEGLIMNYSDDPQSFIKVNAAVFERDGEYPITTASSFAGNQLNSVQLSSFRYEKIQEILQREYGDQLSNYNLRQKGRLPFQIIIVPPPENYETVRVTANPTLGK